VTGAYKIIQVKGETTAMLWNRQKGKHLRANMDRQDHPQWMTNEGNISRGSVSWTMEESQGAGLNIRVCRVNVKDTPPNGGSLVGARDRA
jgi:hypothetical protein